MSRVSPRTYLPLDCRVFEDDKIIKAGERAAFLYLNILCAIKLDGADGTITERKISRLHVDKWRQRVDKLIAAELLLVINGPSDDDPDAEIEYLVPAWSRWNMLTADIERKRSQARIAAETRWNRNASASAPRTASAYTKIREDKKRSDSEITTLGSSVDNVMQRLERGQG